MRSRPAGAFAAALFLLASAFAYGDGEPVEQSSVEAAFLFKFCGYVDWSASAFARPDAPFVIEVVNADAVASELERIARGRSVATHPVVVRRNAPGDSPAGANLLFVGGDDPDPALILAAERAGALVVTESPQGLAAGSAINFVTANDHVGFEVSIDAAQRSGHRISARLLSVARRVVQKGAS